MVKKITAIALIILALIMGVSSTNAQVIKPVTAVVNDNLLNKSLSLDGKIMPSGSTAEENIWSLLHCSFDTTKYVGCNSIKSSISQDGSAGNWFSDAFSAIQTTYSNPPGSNATVFSCFCELENNNINDVRGWVQISAKYKDGTDGMLTQGTVTKIHISGNIYRLVWYFPSIYAPDIVSFKIGGFYVSQENASRANVGTMWISKPKLEYGTQVTPYCPSIYDNVNWDYDQYGASFQSQKVGDIQDITEYQYKKSLTDVGLFSMTIPLDTPYADEIAEDYYLFVDKKDWLLVQDVKKTETGYAITGTDLKGILATRITLYDVVNDTMGFDSVSGSTEECCKHYIANNIVNPIDPNRTIPLVTLVTNQNRGIANDTYMSRFEYLHEVIKKLCENAKIGYTMYADVPNNKIIFDIVNIVDKTIDQQDRNRVVFDVKNKNVLSYERAKGNSTYKNAFYATKSGGGLETDATTKLCHPTATAPKGIARKEIHLNVSCESVADIETYAKYQYKDYAKIDSLAIAPADVNGYGVIFDVGDKVTQKIDDEYVNTVIQSAEETYSGGNYNVTINFGDEQPQPLKYLKTMINNKGV